MGIKSIRIKNILSFDDVYIDSLKDFNLIIGTEITLENQIF